MSHNQRSLILKNARLAVFDKADKNTVHQGVAKAPNSQANRRDQ